MASANFDLNFSDIDDDVSIFITQESKPSPEHNVNEVSVIDLDVESLVNMTDDSACNVFLSTCTIMYVSCVIPLVNRWTCICTQA